MTKKPIKGGDTMSNFHVLVREVHVQTVKVEAKNQDEAIKKVREGEGEYLNNSLTYSHTLDSEFWTVEEIKEKNRG